MRNGVRHLSAALVALPLAAVGAGAAAKDIIETVRSSGSFCTWLKAAHAAGLDDVLKGPGPFTLFAPTDEAFAALPADAVAKLMRPENHDKLVAFVKRHVVPERLLASDLAGRRRLLATLSGDSVEVDATQGELVVGDAEVLRVDGPSDNGIVYVIDSVVMPD